MRPPPALDNLDPQTMTDGELERAHAALSEWIEEALGASPGEAPDDDAYDTVYASLAGISSERAERQRDDRSGRPLRPFP
jgi:hypothetical protein